MKLNGMRQRPEIRAVLAKLRRIERRHVLTNLDYSSIAGQMRRLIDKRPPGMHGDLEKRVHAYIDTHIAQMRAGLVRQHHAYLFELDQLRMLVRPLVEGYRVMVDNDERRLDQMRNAVIAAIEDIADINAPKVFRVGGPRAPEQDDAPDVHRIGELGYLAGVPRGRFLYWIVLLVAAGVDAATFYQVVAIAMPEVVSQVVWTVVAGFTVTALALAHLSGSQAKHRVEQKLPATTSPSAWALAVVWLTMGGAAFLVRYLAPGTGGVEYSDATGLTSTSSAVLPALMFLTLYLSTGAVAFMGGYKRLAHPILQYPRAKRAEAAAARRLARSRHVLESAEAVLAQIAELKARAEGPLTAALEACTEAANRLKLEASMHLRRRGRHR